MRGRFSHRLAMESETDDQSMNAGDYCYFLRFSDLSDLELRRTIDQPRQTIVVNNG